MTKPYDDKFTRWSARPNTRVERIAALAYIHKHAADHNDFILLTDHLGLDDLLHEREGVPA